MCQVLSKDRLLECPSSRRDRTLNGVCDGKDSLSVVMMVMDLNEAATFPLLPSLHSQYQPIHKQGSWACCPETSYQYQANTAQQAKSGDV